MYICTLVHTAVIVSCNCNSHIIHSFFGFACYTWWLTFIIYLIFQVIFSFGTCLSQTLHILSYKCLWWVCYVVWFLTLCVTSAYLLHWLCTWLRCGWKNKKWKFLVVNCCSHCLRVYAAPSVPWRSCLGEGDSKGIPSFEPVKTNKKLSYRLENRASVTYFFVAKLISIAHSCL